MALFLVCADLPDAEDEAAFARVMAKKKAHRAMPGVFLLKSRLDAELLAAQLRLVLVGEPALLVTAVPAWNASGAHLPDEVGSALADMRKIDRDGRGSPGMSVQ